MPFFSATLPYFTVIVGFSALPVYTWLFTVAVHLDSFTFCAGVAVGAGVGALTVL